MKLESTFSAIRHFLPTTFVVGALALQSSQASATATTAPVDLFNLSLEELLAVDIKSSGFFAMSAEQSPGSVWVFSQQELQSSPIVYLRDLFEYYVPSTSVSYSRFAGPVLGVRGIATDNNSKTLLMMNGQNLNLKNHYGFQAGLQSVLFGDVDRVEVILGPGSIMHGSGAINSLVNLISKNGHDYQGFSLNTNYGIEEGLASIELGYGADMGDQRNIYLYGGIANANGFTPDSLMELGDNSPAKHQPNNSTYSLENLRLSAYVNWDDLKFQSQFQQIQPGLNRYLPPKDSAINGDDYYYQTTWVSQFQYDLRLNEKSHIEFTLPLELIDHGIKFWNQNFEKGGRQNRIGIKSTYFVEQETSKFALGVGFAQRQFDAGKQYFGADSDYSEETVNASLAETELFGEYTWQATDKLTVIAGLRYDQVGYSKMGLMDKREAPTGVVFGADDLAAVSKRVAASYVYSEQQTYKLSYQEGFRYPDVGYFRYIGLINANLAAKGFATLPTPTEETVKSLQFNYLYSFNQLPLKLDFTTYYNRYNNLIDWGVWSADHFSSEAMFTAAYTGLPWSNVATVPRADWVVESYQNINSEINAWGIELASVWQASDNFSMRASYAFSRPSQIAQDANTLVLLNTEKSRWASFPEHLLKLAINHSFAPNWHYNATLYYGSSVDICTSADCALDAAIVDYHQQDRIRVNLKLSNQLSKNLRVNLVVQNAFENEGAPVGAESRFGLATHGAWGDDARKMYVGLNWSL